jgi:hypothetical protein
MRCMWYVRGVLGSGRLCKRLSNMRVMSDMSHVSLNDVSSLSVSSLSVSPSLVSPSLHAASCAACPAPDAPPHCSSSLQAFLTSSVTWRLAPWRLRCVRPDANSSRGMAWNGVEWRGMAWNGVEWRGMAWNGGGSDHQSRSSHCSHRSHSTS